MSLKESRDSYYFEEIKYFIKKDKKFNKHQIFYVTVDEISNIRSILYKMSTINIQGGIPRYIMSLNENKMVLKYFNIFHNLIDNNKILTSSKQETSQKFNSQLLLKSGKTSIIKNITGGKKIENNILKIYTTNTNTNNIKMNNSDINSDIDTDNNSDNIPYDDNIDNDTTEYIYTPVSSIKTIKTNYEIITTMNIKEIIDNKDYKNIELLIIYSYKKFSEIYDLLSEDEFDTIIKISQNDKETIQMINECNKIFENLEYLYEKINYLELIDKLVFENDSMYQSIFNVDIKLYHNEYYKLYKKNYREKIKDDTWRGFYIAWLIDSQIFYEEQKEKCKFLKRIFPRIFETYTIEEFLKIINIYKALDEDFTSNSEED